MGEVSIIGLDLAKNVFQAHGAAADGSVVFRHKLSRAQLLKFMAAQRPCVVAMEACASSHHWGRAIGNLGHISPKKWIALKPKGIWLSTSRPLDRARFHAHKGGKPTDACAAWPPQQFCRSSRSGRPHGDRS